MEKIIHNVMMNHLALNKLIASEQYGFFNGKNCCSNLLETLDFITSKIETGNNIDIIYLDFAKSFDSFSLSKLCCKLYGYGFQSYIILQWCKSFLSNRKQRVVLGEFASDWQSQVEFPSVLGPLLFIIFINDLKVNILNKSELFADDTKIMPLINNESNNNALQEDLNKLLDWSNKLFVKFNRGKCKTMHIGNLNPQFNYKLEDHILQKTEVEKDLGSIISNDRKWENYVINLANKANRTLGFLKHGIKYLDVSILKLLYNSNIRPQLKYAASVWSPFCTKDIKRLENVQRRSTRIESLKGICYEERRKVLGLPTLQERRRRGDLIEIFKILNSTEYIRFEEPLSFYNSMSRYCHNKRLHRQYTKKFCSYYYLTNRVVGDWNLLSQDAIDSVNKNTFKNRIDKILNF
ncbi:uncharacterized protein LOC136091965 [Hydra vulgaris]|uniref:Uncharacterized protein LOC136091965 n=1 Tax=Hydra vulgaris TaxID=6087 RepID=A0ABM4DMH6_HYDVU